MSVIFEYFGGFFMDFRIKSRSKMAGGGKTMSAYGRGKGEKMSNTPRTDKAMFTALDERHYSPIRVVHWKIAAKFENELAEARAEVERKDALIKQMREALRWALTEARSTHCEDLIKAALEAAEGITK